MQREPDLQRTAASLAFEGIASDDLALDLMLHDVAEQACQITGASGAAIALQRDGSVVCRAAAGATAPDLGVRINTESGLTGACWRMREPQVCRDTDADARVDAEACRQLGVRSVMVLPLFLDTTLVGVFEILSPHPHAFSDRDLEKLQELSRSITKAMQSAAEGESRPAPAPAPGPVLVSPPPQRIVPRSPEPLVPDPSATAKPSRPADRQTRILRLVVLGLAIVLCLLLGFRWGWDKARLSTPATNSAAPSQPAQAGTSAAQPSDITLGSIPQAQAAQKKAAGVPNRIDRQPNDEAVIVYQNDRLAVKQNAAAREELPETQVSKTSDSAAADRPADSSKEPAAAPPPKTEEIAALTSQLSLRSPSLPPLSPAVAAPAIRVSQGVTGGKLIRRVPPRYPPAARQQRIQGAVVLQAQIDKEGRVKAVKVINGNSLLAHAAITAVKEWRYEPYKLNGQTVEMSAQITLNFTLD